MMINANADILLSLARFYQDLMANEGFDLRDDLLCKRAVADFLVELQDCVHDFKMHSDRTATLGKITADRKNLVCSSSFIDGID
jgi:hypothetical protein